MGCVILILGIFASLWAGVFNQLIDFTTKNFSSDCSASLRSDTDSFFLSGTLGPDFIGLNRSGWEPVVSVEIMTSGQSQFEEMCNISFRDVLKDCYQKPENWQCACERIEASGTAIFAINTTALQRQSQGTVRVAWRHSNGTTVYSTTNITLPTIYDPTATSLTLTLNDHQLKITSSNCTDDLIPGKYNFLELCCTNPTLPCYPRLELDGQPVGWGLPSCVNHTVMPDNQTYSSRINAKFSLCAAGNLTFFGSCFLETRSIILTTSVLILTTTTVRNSNDSTTEPRNAVKAKEPDTELIVGLAVGLTVGACALLALGIFFLKYKNKKMLKITSSEIKKSLAKTQNGRGVHKRAEDNRKTHTSQNGVNHKQGKRRKKKRNTDQKYNAQGTNTTERPGQGQGGQDSLDRSNTSNSVLTSADANFPQNAPGDTRRVPELQKAAASSHRSADGQAQHSSVSEEPTNFLQEAPRGTRRVAELQKAAASSHRSADGQGQHSSVSEEPTIQRIQPPPRRLPTLNTSVA